MNKKKTQNKSDQTALKLFTKFWKANFVLIFFTRSVPTSLCELSEREVTSPTNLKVVKAMYALLHVMYDIILYVFIL